MQQSQGNGGLAIASLILGIVGIVGSWIPILNTLAAVIGLIGLILGIIAIVMASRRHAKKGMAIAGTILSVLAIVIVLATQAFYGSVLDEVSNQLDTQELESFID